MTRTAAGIVALIVVLAALAAYGPTVGYKYAQDSYHAVRASEVLERGDPWEMLTSDYWKGTVSPARTLYRPVTVISFSLERRLAGAADPAVSHAVNVLLHLGVAWLLALWIGRLGGGAVARAAAAILWTVHPVLLQGVANVVGRADILAAGFGVGALWLGTWAFAGPSDPVGWRQRVGLYAAPVLALLALGSKEIGAAFPVLLILQTGLCRRPVDERSTAIWRGRLVQLLLVVGVVLVYMTARSHAIGEFPGLQRVAVEDNLLVRLDGAERAATAVGMAARYLGLLVAPLHLSPDHSGATILAEGGWLSPRPLIGLLFLTGLALLTGWAGARARRPGGEPWRPVACGGALFLLAYLMVGNLLVLNAAGFAERLIYVPAAGFVVLAAALLQGASDRLSRWHPRVGPVGASVVLALISIFGVLKIREQSPMWRDQQALFAHAARVTPFSLRAHLVRTGELRRKGAWSEALEANRLWLERSEEDPAIWIERGGLLLATGDGSGAAAAARRALRLRPDDGEAWSVLGRALAASGTDWAEADRSLRRSLLHRPDLVVSAVALADLLFEQGRFAEAEYFYRGSIRLGRTDLEPRRREAARGAER